MIVILGVVILIVVFRKKSKYSKNDDSGSGEIVSRMPKASLRDIREITGKHEYPIKSPSFSIGRAPKNQVVIDKPTISTRHATIEFRENAFYLVDQRSTNGTTANGQKITTELRLKHGDRIGFDQYEFIFAVEEFADEAKTQLRGEEPLTVRSVSQQPGPGAPAASSNDEAPTKLKDMCPNHPSWKATELCSVCRIAYCDKCIIEKDGRKICAKCNKTVTAI